ncbi:MAG: hypothetical protein ACRD0K_16515 [Egibacteraceae bacterium]
MTTTDVRLRVFPNYNQVRAKVSQRVWGIARLLTVVAALELCIVLVVLPRVGLFLFWDLFVPLLPLLLLVAPGLWRNICPIAAMNQTPRLLRLTKARPVPGWVQRHGTLIGTGLFVAIIATRKVLFDTSGPALAGLLGTVFALALIGGARVKGKGGWCTTLCPMVPVERLYGQTPLVSVRNSHCESCVGCAKHCLDFNPQTAYLSEQYSADRVHALRRRLFAGAFPGLTLWFFLVPAPPEISLLRSFGLLGLAMMASAGSFFTLDAVLGVRRLGILPALYGALTLNLYYFFAAPAFFTRLGILTATPARAVQLTALLLSAIWLIKTVCKEQRYVASQAPSRRRSLPLLAAPTESPRQGPRGYAPAPPRPRPRSHPQGPGGLLPASLGAPSETRNA